MKTLAIILSAGVIIGLLVYGVLDWCGALGLIGGNLVTMRIAVFVGTLASVGFGAAALALVFRHGIARADRSLVQQLEQRLARLENGAPRAGGQP